MAYPEISRGGVTRAAARGRRNPKGRQRYTSHCFVARRGACIEHAFLLASRTARISWRRRHDGYSDRLIDAQ